MDYGKDTLNYTLRKIWSIQLVPVTTKKIGSMLRLPGKTVQKIETFPKKKKRIAHKPHCLMKPVQEN